LKITVVKDGTEEVKVKKRGLFNFYFIVNLLIKYGSDRKK